MFKIKSTILLTSMLTILITHTANATIHEKNFYVEANMGTLYESVNFWGISYQHFGDLGVNVNGGYLWSRYFATEIGYTNYSVTGKSLNNIDIALKGILTLGNDFTLFGKIGPAYLFVNGDHQFEPFAGLGASYSMTRKLDVTTQAQGISNGFFSLGLLSLGVTYHFD